MKLAYSDVLNMTTIRVSRAWFVHPATLIEFTTAIKGGDTFRVSVHDRELHFNQVESGREVSHFGVAINNDDDVQVSAVKLRAAHAKKLVEFAKECNMAVEYINITFEHSRMILSDGNLTSAISLVDDVELQSDDIDVPDAKQEHYAAEEIKMMANAVKNRDGSLVSVLDEYFKKCNDLVPWAQGHRRRGGWIDIDYSSHLDEWIEKLEAYL